MLHKNYHIAVVDVGSPKLGNLGWCCLGSDKQTGTDLDVLAKTMAHSLGKKAFILGLEAPLFVPLREDIMLATKGRLGEGRRPWSGVAGAQVLALNLPIMIYLFKAILKEAPNAEFVVNPKDFKANAGQILIFEALVSGSDKGLSHIEDAEIMVNYCAAYAQEKTLPKSILQTEEDTAYFNIVAAALLRLNVDLPLESLQEASPIYKPTENVL